jgi:hypothetical protein
MLSRNHGRHSSDESRRAFAARANTACKLSGLVTEAPPGAPPGVFSPVADVILEAFGADRVMFGSDWPVCLLARDYAGVLQLTQLLTAGLSDAERAAVFSSTALRLYGIGLSVPSQTRGAAGGPSARGPWRRSYWPRTSRMPSPYLASLDSPTPLIPASSSSEDGAAAAIARRVASWKTT